MNPDNQGIGSFVSQWVTATFLGLVIASGNMIPVALRAGEVRYRVVPLEGVTDPLMVFTLANGISDNGFVTGYAQTERSSEWRGAYVAFHYHPETGYTNLGNLLPDHSVRGISVNNRGQIAAIRNGPTGDKAMRYTPGIGFEDLGNLGVGAGECEAFGINEAGQVVGKCEVLDGDVHAFRFTDGTGMEDLGTLGGTYGNGVTINDLGWVTGSSKTPDEAWHAFLYRDGEGMQDLGPGFGVSINNQGTVAGISASFGSPILITGPNTVELTSIGYGFGIGSINNSDVFVGKYGYFDEFRNARGTTFIASESEGVIDLNGHIPESAGWVLGNANGINDDGQIVGGASFNRRFTAVRLDPIPPTLQAAQTGNEVVISWSPAWPGLVLEGANSLSGSAWLPVETGGTNLLQISASDSRRFYRLNLTGAAGWCCPPEPAVTLNRPPFPVTYVIEPLPFGASPVLVKLDRFLFLSPDGAHARIVMDGQAYDPDGDSLTVEWGDIVDGDYRVFGRTGLVTNVFDRLGLHDIQFRVSDGKVAATNGFLAEIVTPTYVMTQLIAFVEQSPNTRPDAGRFLALLRKALREFERDNYPSAVSLVEEALQLAQERPVSALGRENSGIEVLLFRLLEELARPLSNGIDGP